MAAARAHPRRDRSTRSSPAAASKATRAAPTRGVAAGADGQAPEERILQGTRSPTRRSPPPARAAGPGPARQLQRSTSGSASARRPAGTRAARRRRGDASGCPPRAPPLGRSTTGTRIWPTNRRRTGARPPPPQVAAERARAVDDQLARAVGQDGLGSASAPLPSSIQQMRDEGTQRRMRRHSR